MTISELANWLAANSTTIATPAAFAQPDSFKYTVEDDIWGIPHGVDNTFIPGVK